jgi:helix-turn-helix protein
MAMTTTFSRRAWTLLEPIHALVYFAPETRDAYAAAGLRGAWMGYFASRSAPMGAVSADVVVATFHNHHPALVRRAIPDAWRLSSPERVLEARHAIVDAALRRLWGDTVDTAGIREAADLALRVALAGDPGGRPLFAAHAGLPVPEQPHLALWHACTLIREHRFEGHVAALIVHGFDGREALVTAVASKPHLDAATMRAFRGLSDEEWRAAEEGLSARGLLDDSGALTAEGRAQREAVEVLTDDLAAAPWSVLSTAERDRLLDLALPLARALTGEGGMIYPNPVGVPEPA